MKRLNLIFLCFVFSGQFMQAQNNERNLSIVEVATGTWCFFCPGSAWGADDLVDKGHNVAILEYHNSDDFENAASINRIGFYNVSAYPTAFFNGGNKFEGGSNNTSSYPNYVNVLNTIDTISSDIKMEMDLTQSNPNTLGVKVKLTKLTLNPTLDLKLHLALTESQISHDWFSLDHVNFVVQEMYPNATGTIVNLLVLGDTATVEYSIAIDPTWQRENFELVAFVQQSQTKEIFNGQKRPLRPSVHPNDAGILAIKKDFDQSYCGDEYSPQIEIVNWGLDSLHSLDIQYSVNGGIPQTYQWTGSLATYEKINVILPAYAYTTQAQNTAFVTLQNPNGQSDGDFSDNGKNTFWDGLITTEGQHALYLKLDNLGTQTTWLMRGPFGLIGNGGPYGFMDTTIKVIPLDIQNYSVHETECYTLEFYDTGGNGLTWDFDGTPGYYYLLNASGDTVIYSDGDFADKEIHNFTVTWTTGVEEQLAADAVQAFPNPTQDKLFVKMTERSAQQYQWEILDIQGRKISGGVENRSEFAVDLSAYPSGLYQMVIQTESGIWTDKIFKR